MKTILRYPLTLSAALLAQPLLAQVEYIEITDDATSGISSDLTYTHAIDFGRSGTAIVNGVVFSNDINMSAGGRTNSGSRTYGPVDHNGNPPPAVIGDVFSLFEDMRYNGPDPGIIELTGLVPGERYILRLYERAWDYQNTIRTFTASFDVGSNGTADFTTPQIDQNDASLPTPGLSGNVSYALSYEYQADANGSITVTIDLADDRGGTYHIYGLTNSVNPEGGSSYTFGLDDSVFSSGASQGDLVGNLSALIDGEPDPSTYSLVAGEGDDDNEKFQINGEQLEVADFDFSEGNSTDGQTYSVRIKGDGTDSQEKVIRLTIMRDEDADNLLDAWETRWVGNLNDLSAKVGDEDFDQDGLTNSEEFQVSIGSFNGSAAFFPDIDPTMDDADSDDLKDGEEINPSGDRPVTNPLAADTDGDGLSDLVETNTGTYIDADDSGSDPTNCDTDGDFANDFWEATHNSDPSDANAIPGPVGPVEIVNITDDASTGIDPAKTYTHLISGGDPATINGVAFDAFNPNLSAENFTWETGDQSMNQVISNPGAWDPVAAEVSFDLETLFNSFTYSGNGPNPGNSQKFTLSSLTPGVTYDLRIYSRVWSTEASGRPIDLVFTNGPEVTQPFGSIPWDRAGIVTGTGNIHDAYYLSFRYTAQASELVIDATVPTCSPNNSGSFHMYALSNEIATGVPPGQIVITQQAFTSANQFLIAFQARPQTEYKVTKSSDLAGGFVPLDPPLTVTTDIDGEGLAIIPASEISDLKEFYRIEE